MCFLQSEEIREPSKVRTQGSISSHLKKEEKEGGRQEKRRRGDVLFLFLDAEGCCVFISFDYVHHFITVCVLLMSTLDFCVYMCIPVYPRGFICMSVMLFTQAAVSAQQSLCAAVNLWLIYLSSSLFLVDYNYSLCNSVFHDKKHGSYSICNRPNVFSLTCVALKLESIWLG